MSEKKQLQHLGQVAIIPALNALRKNKLGLWRLKKCYVPVSLRRYFNKETKSRVKISFFYFVFLVAQQPSLGLGRLSFKTSRSHSDTPQSVGLLWTSDQPDAETATWQHKTLTRCSGGFEPAFPASERPQAYALDRVSIGTGPIREAILTKLGSTSVFRRCMEHELTNTYLSLEK